MHLPRRNPPHIQEDRNSLLTKLLEVSNGGGTGKYEELTLTLLFIKIFGVVAVRLDGQESRGRTASIRFFSPVPVNDRKTERRVRYYPGLKPPDSRIRLHTAPRWICLMQVEDNDVDLGIACRGGLEAGGQ